MQSVYTILLLIVSNIFMTCAWYGHLKMKKNTNFYLFPLQTIQWIHLFQQYSLMNILYL